MQKNFRLSQSHKANIVQDDGAIFQKSFFCFVARILSQLLSLLNKSLDDNINDDDEVKKEVINLADVLQKATGG